MLKSVNKGKKALSSSLSEEFTAVFDVKMSQNGTGNDKIKSFHFQKFLRYFRQFFDKLRSWKTLGVNNKKIVSPVVFSKGFIAFF